EKSYNPIALCRYFTGYSFIEALKYLYAEFNIGETDTFIKPNTTFSDTDLEPGHYEIIEASEYKNLDVVGRFLTVETAAEYDFIPVKEYSFVVRNKKTNRPALCKIEATDTFPIFAYKFESWAKIYQPMDRKFKHS